MFENWYIDFEFEVKQKAVPNILIAENDHTGLFNFSRSALFSMLTSSCGKEIANLGCAQIECLMFKNVLTY